MKWTKQQKKVIDVRNKNVLVSAAAGSGKTAVLVERIISLITDEDNPINIDRLLVVTFTNAAAAQMRERIGKAIENQLLKTPDNINLQKQLTLLHTAHITTIHSFCLNVIRNYFYTIDLDPSFRMAEESEITLLKSDVISNILDRYYEEGSEEFLKFVESYSNSKSDIALEEIILKLYDFSISYPWPKEWIEEKEKVFSLNSVEELDQIGWIKDLVKYIKFIIDDLLAINNQIIDICQLPDGPSAYLLSILSDQDMLKELKKIDKYSDYYNALSNITFKRLSGKKEENVSKENKEKAKGLREQVKKALNDIVKQFYFQEPEEMIKDMLSVKEVMSVLFKITSDFIDEFALKKQEKNIIDFNDLEHLALEILIDKKDGLVRPTDAALELSEHFVEISIDEYQDSNLVQETILNSISKEREGKPNIFMVGDVKQSIYKFRLAMPELFMGKFNDYNIEDEIDGQENLYQRIDLDKNFRSRDIVLNCVNDIFKQIMRKDAGGIDYDINAFLKVGADYENTKKTANSIECLLVTTNDREIEGRMIAKKIQELVDPLDGLMILDDKSKEYRLAKYSDIVILLRTMKGWGDVFVDSLMQEGIPAYTETSTGYFQTLEIKTLTSLLQIIDNPRQDIALAAVLLSPIVGISTNDLARIKAFHKKDSLYNALLIFADESDEGQVKVVINKFLTMLNEFRYMVSYKPIAELIMEILDKTNYYHYVSVLPGGERRQGNIDLLISHAKRFGQGSNKGLFHFVRYIEKLKKYDVDFGEAAANGENDNTVRIMTIHKSKGLEFPIVFLSGAGKEFNMMDARDKILFHFENGVGPDYIDLDKRTKVATIIKKVIQNNITIENLGEELRVLYVALTRAKEQLIISGHIKDNDNVVGKDISFYDIISAKTYLDWIIPSLVNAGYMDSIKVMDSKEIYDEEKIKQLYNKIDKEIIKSIDKDLIYNEDYKKSIDSILNYKYPYDNLRKLAVKLSVSEIKRRSQSVEEDQSKVLVDNKENKDNKDNLDYIISDKSKSASNKGILYHKLIEKIDLLETTNDNLNQEIEKLINNNFITKEEVELLNLKYIENFINSKIAQRMRKAQKINKLYKERPFVIGVNANEIEKDIDTDEIVLVQGIIDCYFEESEELILVDYKSDYIQKGNEETLIQRYKIQMEYYKKALEQITNKKVKETIIYSMSLGKEVIIE